MRGREKGGRSEKKRLRGTRTRSRDRHLSSHSRQRQYVLASAACFSRAPGPSCPGGERAISPPFVLGNDSTRRKHVGGFSKDRAQEQYRPPISLVHSVPSGRREDVRPLLQYGSGQRGCSLLLDPLYFFSALCRRTIRLTGPSVALCLYLAVPPICPAAPAVIHIGDLEPPRLGLALPYQKKKTTSYAIRNWNMAITKG